MVQTSVSGTGNQIKMVGRERYNVIRTKKRTVQVDDLKYMFPWALDDKNSGFNEKQIEELEQESKQLQKRLTEIKEMKFK